MPIFRFSQNLCSNTEGVKKNPRNLYDSWIFQNILWKTIQICNLELFQLEEIRT